MKKIYQDTKVPMKKFIKEPNLQDNIVKTGIKCKQRIIKNNINRNSKRKSRNIVINYFFN